MEEQPSSFNFYKFFFFLFLFVLVLGTVAAGSYYYGMSNKFGVTLPAGLMPVTTTPGAPTGTNATGSATGATTPASGGATMQPGVDGNVVPVTANTVQFSRKDGKVLLLYRNKVYDESNQGAMEPVQGVDSSSLTWYGLVDAPANVPANEFMYDEVFGLKTAPNGKDFAFIMRWGPKVANQDTIEYYLYHYSPAANPKVTLLKKFSPSEKMEGGYYIPKIDMFNPTSEFVSLNLFPCWNCGGAQTVKVIGDIAAKTIKLVGTVSAFEFGTGRTYTFKEYKEVPCPPDIQMGPCSEKPENLPVQNGSF